MSRFVLVIGGLIVFAAGGLVTAVVSAHGGDPALVHACVSQKGNLRVVGPDDGCRQNETALDWNITGPAGPAAAELRSITNTNSKPLAPGTWDRMTAVCEAGQVLLGGGFKASTSGDVQIVTSMPNANGSVPPTGWTVEAINHSATTQHPVWVYAVCSEAATPQQPLVQIPVGPPVRLIGSEY